jgi:hypothetical protein
MAIFRQRKLGERRIFFPWEARGGVRRFLALGRLGPALLLASTLAFVWWVARRERHAGAERRTRVALSALRGPVERYLLEHEGACPAKLTDVLAASGLGELPRDGWGRQLRLVCPTDRPDVPYVLMSDGPDAEPGGRDRIEF